MQHNSVCILHSGHDLTRTNLHWRHHRKGLRHLCGVDLHNRKNLQFTIVPLYFPRARFQCYSQKPINRCDHCRTVVQLCELVVCVHLSASLILGGLIGTEWRPRLQGKYCLRTRSAGGMDAVDGSRCRGGTLFPIPSASAQGRDLMKGVCMHADELRTRHAGSVLFTLHQTGTHQ